MTELDDLIRDQARDMKYEYHIFHEEGVSFSLQTELSGEDAEGDMGIYLQDGETLRIRTSKTWTGCAIHGRSAMYIRPNGGFQCRGCDHDRYILRRDLAGGRRRKVCEHGDTDRNTQGRCRACIIIRLRMKGVRERGTINTCPHEGRFRKRTPKGHTYCYVCVNERNRLYRERRRTGAQEAYEKDENALSESDKGA